MSQLRHKRVKTSGTCVSCAMVLRLGRQGSGLHTRKQLTRQQSSHTRRLHGDRVAPHLKPAWARLDRVRGPSQAASAPGLMPSRLAA